MKVCVKVEVLEGKNEAVEEAVNAIHMKGDEALILATKSVRAGETSERMHAMGVKMYDTEHQSAFDMPKVDKTIDLSGGAKLEEMTDEQKEAEKLAAQIERAKKNGLEVTGKETYEQLEEMIKEKKKVDAKEKREAKKNEKK